MYIYISRVSSILSDLERDNEEKYNEPRVKIQLFIDCQCDVFRAHNWLFQLFKILILLWKSKEKKEKWEPKKCLRGDFSEQEVN